MANLIKVEDIDYRSLLKTYKIHDPEDSVYNLEFKGKINISRDSKHHKYIEMQHDKWYICRPITDYWILFKLNDVYTTKDYKGINITYFDILSRDGKTNSIDITGSLLDKIPFDWIEYIKPYKGEDEPSLLDCMLLDIKDYGYK